MPQAKVTEPFIGRADGEAQSRTFEKDEVISGDLADVAISQRKAVEISERAAEKAQAKAARKDEGDGKGGDKA